MYNYASEKAGSDLLSSMLVCSLIACNHRDFVDPQPLEEIIWDSIMILL